MVIYVPNIFNSIVCRLGIRQLQRFFASQTILDISLSVSIFFINDGFKLFFVLNVGLRLFEC